KIAAILDGGAANVGVESTGYSPVQSITVDSTPTFAAPPSNIAAIFPSISSLTCVALVGLGFPDKLALGAATGRLAAISSARAAGWLGIRIPTVSNPAVTKLATVPLLFRTYVIGPGEKTF